MPSEGHMGSSQSGRLCKLVTVKFLQELRFLQKGIRTVCLSMCRDVAKESLWATAYQPSGCHLLITAIESVTWEKLWRLVCLSQDIYYVPVAVCSVSSYAIAQRVQSSSWHCGLMWVAVHCEVTNYLLLQPGTMVARQPRAFCETNFEALDANVCRTWAGRRMVKPSQSWVASTCVTFLSAMSNRWRTLQVRQQMECKLSRNLDFVYVLQRLHASLTSFVARPARTEATQCNCNASIAKSSLTVRGCG